MSTNTRIFKYYKVAKLHSEFFIEFTDLQEFYRFADANQIRSLFQLIDADGHISHFAASHKGGLLRQASIGFQTIEDFHDARTKQFPDAALYYQGIAAGYKHYDDYKIVNECGIEDKDLFELMKLQGYIQGFENYCQASTEQPAQLLKTYDSPLALYTDAQDNGFPDFATLLAAHLNGFDNYPYLLVARDKGFELAAEYQTAKDLGFVTYENYIFARDLGIDNVEEVRLYLDLYGLSKKAEPFDQRVLLVLLSKLPQGKKVSINKINDLLQQAIIQYHKADTNALPAWFTTSFSGIADIVSFFSTNTNINEYGSYHNDGEYFETKKLQERKVVLDGSNVAHNSQGSATSKPLVANILLMIKELRSHGFEEITVITDASLRHRLADKDKLDELKEACSYREAPAETSADAFIINYVKAHHCLLVSNDTFRDWKMQDPWIAQNIDYYRLTFLIEGGNVILPDLQ